jgi:hypothetical protein
MFQLHLLFFTKIAHGLLPCPFRPVHAASDALQTHHCYFGLQGRHFHFG